MRISFPQFVLCILAAALSLIAVSPARAQTASDNIARRNSSVDSLIYDGDYRGALKLAEKLVGVAEQTLGPDGQQTLRAIANLARVYKAVGRYAEAETLYKRALARSEQVLGPENWETLVTVNNLASSMKYKAATGRPRRSSNGYWKAISGY